MTPYISLQDEQERVQIAIEKEKAAKRLREEQQIMDELIAEQIKLKLRVSNFAPSSQLQV